MNDDKTSNNTNDQPMRQYTPNQECINNIPYAGMTFMGMVIFLVAFSGSTLGKTAAGIYLLYGISGAFWIMIFVCPFCA